MTLIFTILYICDEDIEEELMPMEIDGNFTP